MSDKNGFRIQFKGKVYTITFKQLQASVILDYKFGLILDFFFSGKLIEGFVSN